MVFLLLFVFGILAFFSASIYYPEGKTTSKNIEKEQFKLNFDMIQIYSASFMLSTILSIFLFVYPLMWRDQGKSTNELSIVYLIVFLPAALFVYPLIRYFEKIKFSYVSFDWSSKIILFTSIFIRVKNIFATSTPEIPPILTTQARRADN